MAGILRRPLGGRRFDLVIDTQRRVKTTLILRRIRHHVFVSGAARFHLSDRRPAGPYIKRRRMVEAMLDLVAAASGQLPALDHALALPGVYHDAAVTALPGGRYLGLAPGAGGIHKRWPLANFLAVAGQFPHLTPVLLLGPDEVDWAAEIRTACPPALLPLQDKRIEPALAASPLFTIACAQRLAVAVANDSGTGHLLAAGDVPLLSLFGPTDPAKFAPYVTRGAVLRAPDGAGDMAGGAMTNLPVKAVVAAIQGLIRAL